MMSVQEEPLDFSMKLPLQLQVVNPSPSEEKKPKRSRSFFTRDQLEVLEGEYHIEKYLSAPRREVITKRTNLTEKQVKVWFQNRRARERCEHIPDGRRALSLFSKANSEQRFFQYQHSDAERCLQYTLQWQRLYRPDLPSVFYGTEFVRFQHSGHPWVHMSMGYGFGYSPDFLNYAASSGLFRPPDFGSSYHFYQSYLFNGFPRFPPPTTTIDQGRPAALNSPYRLLGV